MQNINEIQNNFKEYDNFLKIKKRKSLYSLKMMYSVHMQNIKKTPIYILKQIIRFFIKLILIPFYNYKIIGLKNDKAILKNTYIEQILAKELNIDLIEIKKKVKLNKKCIKIYKDLFKDIYILLKSSLKKKHIVPLLHRLIDYYMIYYTLDISNLKILLVENDRVPHNLALIHLLKFKGISIKYDNWLIDPINHNDIYCDYYYYPNEYHKNIIESLNVNKSLKYIPGGFLHWDKLKNYKQKNNNKILKIIYFTQFDITINEHIKYIKDITDILESLKKPFEIIVKTHPKENIKKYHLFKQHFPNIKIINEHPDIYKLITTSNYCFSVFSTISIEAKHIIENSYFINYNKNFNLIDYKKIGLDVIKDKNTLLSIFNNKYNLIPKNEFIKKINLNYPHSILKLKDFINKIQYHKNFS